MTFDSDSCSDFSDDFSDDDIIANSKFSESPEAELMPKDPGDICFSWMRGYVN